MKCLTIFIILFLGINNLSLSQQPIDILLPDSTFIERILPLNNEIIQIKNEFDNGNKEVVLKKIANYFSARMSERYFHDWRNFARRFNEYKSEYPEKLYEHERRANEHLQLFNANTAWRLPSIGKDGSEITAYKLRHLARQHKAMDIVMLFFIQDKNSELLKYLVEQVNSLAGSYKDGDYDKEGNAIFESFRAGYRIYNWLYVYNTLLASQRFSWRDQLTYIKTFYYHADELKKETIKFRYGNHHTKGLVALVLTSILFPEFDNSKDNLDKSLQLLTEHILKEIKPDGFQFERSIHYHKGDIDNYFYVYKLAKINNIELPDEYVERYKMMFNALTQLAMPNKKLPVLQDDTDEPWAELNNMSSPMTIGAILFDDPKMKYFTTGKIPSKYYWLFREEESNKFLSMESTRPNYNSVALKDIGYYTMRNGWDTESNYSIISAGLSDRKPDHQHGDMLGLYAYANDQVILPNYQVRYYLHDYSFFKNSFVKNVALVDSMPQGLEWKGNRGGSGFGKFNKLPNPKTILWETNDKYDFFIGSHDGYSEQGVEYYRTIIFFKDGFWIVKDKFISDGHHNYQQIWQGSYTQQDSNHLLSTFPNGSGLSIVQLEKGNYLNSFDSFRGKNNAVVASKHKGNFNFTTLLYPFAHFEERLSHTDQLEFPFRGSWQINKNTYSNEIIDISANQIISNDSVLIILDLLEIKDFESNTILKSEGDYILEVSDREFMLKSINTVNSDIHFKNSIKLSSEHESNLLKIIRLEPGDKIRFSLGNKKK